MDLYNTVRQIIENVACDIIAEENLKTGQKLNFSNVTPPA